MFNCHWCAVQTWRNFYSFIVNYANDLSAFSVKLRTVYLTLWGLTFINFIPYIKIQFAAHTEEHAATTKTGLLMMYRGVIAGICMNRSEHLSTLSVKNVESSALNRSVQTTVTGILRRQTAPKTYRADKKSAVGIRNLYNEDASYVLWLRRN